MNKKIFSGLLTLGVVQSLWGEPTISLEAARAKLSPILDGVLAEHCQGACPGYRIEARKSRVASEDLGFEDAVGAAAPSGLQVSVLVSDSVSPEQRRALQQVLSYRLANALELPVAVQMRSLKAATPGQSAHPDAQVESPLWKTHFADLLWPVAALLLSLLGLSAVFLVLRHRRREAESAYRRGLPLPVSEAEAVGPSLEHQAESLVVERAVDLAWFVEERAGLGDRASLEKVAANLPAASLSARLKLSPTAVGVLADLGQISFRPSAEGLLWLQTELDGAHWRRERETHDPLLAVNRLGQAQLLELWGRLDSAAARALLFSCLDQKRWPNLLAKVSSRGRVEAGLALSQIQHQTAVQLSEARRALRLGLEQVQGGSAATLPEHLVEDYSLYLSESEGRQLWQNLSVEKRPKAVRSLDELIANASQESLRFLSLNMEWENLRALFKGLNAQSRVLLERALPKTLQERLRASADISQALDSEDPAFLAARAQFIGAYRNSHSV